MDTVRRSLVLAIVLALQVAAGAETYKAGTWNYRMLMKQLEAGDTLILEEGDYPGMPSIEVKGRPDAWIVIKGSGEGTPPTIMGRGGVNTIEIRGSCYLALENLTLDGQNIDGAFGINASGDPCHHIRIENCTIVNHGANQSTVAISTKTVAWDWVIRRNRIIGAGTGMYLGDSDGTRPFIGGIVEYNAFLDARGYNLQVKHQNPRDRSVEGIPTEPRKTIIRHNLFLKTGDMNADSGERPNLLVGALPATGLGSDDSYEVYGNVFCHNDRESLFQAEGRVSIHDNVFIDCKGDAVHLQNHYGKVRRIHVYNNTFYGVDTAVRFVHPALESDVVVGNLMFSDNAILGPCSRQADNLHVAPRDAKNYVRNPSFAFGKMDFYPLPGKCRGEAINLSMFADEMDSGRDFNGATRDGKTRGAYAGEGANPGWQIDKVIKGELPPAANDKTPPVAMLQIIDRKATTTGLLVDLAIEAGDGVAGMGEGSEMRFSNDGKDWSDPEPFSSRRGGWDLSKHGGTTEPGLKVIFARVSDAVGNWCPPIVVAIEYAPGAGDAAGAPPAK